MYRNFNVSVKNVLKKSYKEQWSQRIFAEIFCRDYLAILKLRLNSASSVSPRGELLKK
jgi:hypothetical protein